MRTRRLKQLPALATLVAALAAAWSPVRAEPPACTGDCNNDQRVADSELVTGVAIIIGHAVVQACGNLDANSDGGIAIDELVTAVTLARGQCPATASPTPTSTPSATATGTPTPTSTATPTPTPRPTRTTTATAAPVLAENVLEDLVPCQGVADEWDFEVAAGQTITVGADTVDPSTAADLCFSVSCGALTFKGDDDFDCAVQPPRFRCPQQSFAATTAGTCRLTVTTCSPSCTDPDKANYALTIQVDGAPVLATLVQDDAPAGPSGTPKVPPSPSPSPAPGAGLSLQVFTSNTGKTYVVLSLDRVKAFGAQVTSLAVSNSSVKQLNETLQLPDRVLTSFSGVAAGGLPPLAAMRRTALLTGFESNVIAQDGRIFNGEFDPAANGGDGLLVLPGGVRSVAFDGSGSEAVQPITTASGADATYVPAASDTSIVRRFGNETLRREAVVFPNPPAACVGGVHTGTACSEDVECLPGKCGQTSSGATCAADNPTPCDPAEPEDVTCGGARCANRGGRVTGQNVTLDTTFLERVGNPNSQSTAVDGFLLHPLTDMVVFVVDADVAGPLNASASGFLVTGTCDGSGLTKGLPCSTQADCRGDPCTDSLSARSATDSVGGTSAKAPPPPFALKEIGPQVVNAGVLLAFDVLGLGSISQPLTFMAQPLPDGAAFLAAGDVTMNGTADSTDADLILTGVSGEKEQALADVNGDTLINDSDVELLPPFAPSGIFVNRYLFLWKPSVNEMGARTIVFTASDAAGHRDSQAVSITVQGPPLPTSTPTATPPVTPSATPRGISVRGHIRSFRRHDPVANAEVTLIGSASSGSIVHTDASGAYAFTDLPGQDFRLEVKKIGDARGAITLVDGVLVLRIVAGLASASGTQALACDATGNGTLSALDAVYLLQIQAGMRSGVPAAADCGSDWLFIPVPAPAVNQQVIEPQLASGICRGGAIQFSPLAENADDQDFEALLLGDCSGSWLANGGDSGATGGRPQDGD